MNDLDVVPLKNLIAEAVENCHDSDLLDLIYKLLIYDAPSK
jgi:hypothetical protein